METVTRRTWLEVENEKTSQSVCLSILLSIYLGGYINYGDSNPQDLVGGGE